MVCLFYNLFLLEAHFNAAIKLKDKKNYDSRSKIHEPRTLFVLELLHLSDSQNNALLQTVHFILLLARQRVKDVKEKLNEHNGIILRDEFSISFGPVAFELLRTNQMLHRGQSDESPKDEGAC